MSVSSHRLFHVDALKALAAQLIVLHHLSVYGPVAQAMHELLPALSELLFHYGRMAVQVFLVLGGYLSARGLSARGGLLSGHPLELLWRRYLRLALPFMAAVLLTLACSELVEDALPELVPQDVSLAQLLSHALLMHGVLGHEALTVGAWYVAIDFQLFGLLLGLLWLVRSAAGLPRAWRMLLGPGLVLLLCAASLYGFNLMPELDHLALYFFGAYGLGAMVHWLSLSRYPRLALAGLGLLAGGALVLAFRERALLAALTAAVLAAWQLRPTLSQCFAARARLARLLAHHSQHSYALFLVHFPIVLLLNAWVEPQDQPLGAWAAVYLLAAWLLSNVAALPFYRWIEAPAARLRLKAAAPIAALQR
ncbi:acyltransferase family protein [Paucibacter soli]|uniref:acyltransferase family protein n=1 Tax=Paucibacter soli TaxID=3133433 RepID=UPI0030B1BE4F